MVELGLLVGRLYNLVGLTEVATGVVREEAPEWEGFTVVPDVEGSARALTLGLKKSLILCCLRAEVDGICSLTGDTTVGGGE